MKMIFANLDEVPESLRKDAVQQTDGSYVLEGDGVIKKNQELLDKNAKYKSVYDKFSKLENVKPEDIQKALQEMNRADEREAEIQDRIQKAVQEAAKEWQTKMQLVERERDTMRESLEDRIIVADLTTEVSKSDGDPFFVVPALRGHVKAVPKKDASGKLKYVAQVIGEDGKPRLTPEGNEMSLSDLVAEAKGKKEFSRVFTAPAQSGSSTQPAGAGGTKTTAGGGQVITLTREQAKDPVAYREALAKVEGDYSRIQYAD